MSRASSISAIAIASVLAFAPMQSILAQSADNYTPAAEPQCSGIEDPIQYSVCQCQHNIWARNEATSAILAEQMSHDDYLHEVREKKPGNDKSLDNAAGGLGGIAAQSCYSATKSAFDSLLSSAGGFFGIDLGSLLGGAANSAGGNLCGDLNKAITSRLNFNCPRVSIPGFPMNCRGNASINANGVQISTGGQVGGWSTNGYSNTGVNGVSTYSGGVNAGRGASGSISGNTSTGSGNGTGIFSSISNNVSCWISGNC